MGDWRAGDTANPVNRHRVNCQRAQGLSDHDKKPSEGNPDGALDSPPNSRKRDPRATEPIDPCLAKEESGQNITPAAAISDDRPSEANPEVDETAIAIAPIFEDPPFRTPSVATCVTPPIPTKRKRTSIHCANFSRLSEIGRPKRTPCYTAKRPHLISALGPMYTIGWRSSAHHDRCPKPPYWRWKR